MAPSQRNAAKSPCSVSSLFLVSIQILFFLTLFLLVIYFSSNTSHRLQHSHHLRKPALRAQRFQGLCGFVPADVADLGSKSLPLQPWPWLSQNLSLPQNSFSMELQRRNSLPPRNQDLFELPLPDDHLIFVLYVHNRPQYLRLVIDGLSKVHGISETLLIVSHDGFFEEMNSLVEGIRFCQVKQIFAPYSPHLFNESFPGISLGDCQRKGDTKCNGDPDQYGNYRAPQIVSLKHHWWWIMNTVWDGLPETQGYKDHIVFIEEDHFLLPNAYRNIQLLTALKSCKCPDCYAANLAPADVKSKGERTEFLVAEKIGNIGYAFNRTIWRKIHATAREFCLFDDYNWDITMWSAIYPLWGASIFTLRGPRTSAVHFGECGLHQGQKHIGAPCPYGHGNIPAIEAEDKIANIRPDWEVRRYPIIGYSGGFRGWGGWGDRRDHKLCLDFASMYHLPSDTDRI